MTSRPLVSCLALVLACAGCATEAPGQPVSTASTSTSPSRSGEAPPINSPELDLAAYESRMCDLLTPDQAALFAVRDLGKPRNEVVGPICEWIPPDSTAGAVVSAAILSKVGYGWEGIFQRKARWKFFQDAGEINGYPAVHRDTGDATNGTCSTTVGARMDVVLDVIVQVNVPSSPEYKTPCVLSDRAASLMIDTLKKGSR
jgi:hypothetical protein